MNFAELPTATVAVANDPVSQEPESRENAYENEQAPTGAQATGVEEDSSHGGEYSLWSVLFSPLNPLRGLANSSQRFDR